MGVFPVKSKVFKNMKHDWNDGTKESIVVVVSIVEQYIVHLYSLFVLIVSSYQTNT
jgi:hypothetical protein